MDGVYVRKDLGCCLGIAILCVLIPLAALLVPAGLMHLVSRGPLEETVLTWPDGTVRERGWQYEDLVDGGHRRVGEWTFFHQNGVARAQGEYRLAPTGRWTYWYENGERYAKGAFEGNARSGVWTWWYANGQLALRGAFSRPGYSTREGFHGGRAEGPWLFWHENGTLSAHGAYTPAPELDDPDPDDERTRRSRAADDRLDPRRLGDLTTFGGSRASGPWRFWNDRGELDLERSGHYADGELVESLDPVLGDAR